MSNLTKISLTLCAIAIFSFVALSSRVEADGHLQETIRELGGSGELQREAGEWTREAAEAARETELNFEEFLEPPDVDSEAAREQMEDMREFRGAPSGGSCSNRDPGAWCPPSCFRCDPQAY